MTDIRPPVPDDAGEGHTWVAEFERTPGGSLEWRVGGRGRRCRMITGRPRRHCPNQAVVELNRGRWAAGGRVSSWWAYCADHMYGRWIEDGAVKWWRRRPVGA